MGRDGLGTTTGKQAVVVCGMPYPYTRHPYCRQLAMVANEARDLHIITAFDLICFDSL